MSFCYVEKLHPYSLSPASLDWYLSKGWYRMGSNIFTTHFLCFQTQLYSAIWIRLRLSDFQFSKSQRKLLNKNAKIFQHHIAYRKLTQEKEILYYRYASNFNGRLSPSLRDNLEDYDQEDLLFNTHELNVRQRHNNELVAASYFDLGQAAAASILGIYEPSLKEYSLGYYTMLLEIQYCLEKGFEFYYPGYVVPGYQRFDYKLRLGEAEYYDLQSGEWKAFSDFDPLQGPAEKQRIALEQLEKTIKTEDDPNVELCIYPLFEAPLYHIWQAEYVQYPYLLLLKGQPEPNIPTAMVAFDVHSSQYVVLTAISLEDLRYLFNESYLNSFPEKGFIRCLLQKEQELFQSSSVFATAQFIQQKLSF